MKCQYCGVDKHVNSFRKYYNRDSCYTFCNECERIETRRKNLVAKQKRTALSTEDLKDLTNITTLYELRALQGLKTFGRRKAGEVTGLIDGELARVRGEQSE